MNRRSFMKTSLVAGMALVLPKMPELVQAAPHLSGGLATPAASTLHLNFGPDITVTDLYQRDGVWFAQLAQAGRSFWLKSYNGRMWGTLNWQPRPTSSARR